MERDIDKIIALSSQITKLMLQQTHTTLEEKTATILQSQALSFLEQQPNAKMNDVAEHLNTSSSSATQLIERIVSAGFVERVGDEKDRRVVHLSITTPGVEKLKQLKEEKRNRMKKLFSHIDQNDLKELIRIQEKILKSLTEQAKI